MATNENAVWARPGSAAANAEDIVESIPDKIADNTDASPLEDSISGEAEVSVSQTDEAELIRRDRQVDFFNSMSGVDSVEEELNEVYAPQGLLEVPFNDTPYNLGYNIPKLRLNMSKQTKRKVLAFSSIFSAIAVVIAAVVVLNSMFGFIPTVKQVPVFYAKSTKVYMTSSSGRLPEKVLFDGTPYQISSNPNLVRFSPNGEDVLVSADISSNDNTYSLYLRRDMKVSEQGKLIDSNIIGEYEFAFSGNAVLYLKNKGTNDLYFRNLKSDSSKCVERKIESFGMLNENTAVMIAVDGTVSAVTLNKDGTFAANEIAKTVDKLYFDSNKSNAFYYIKTEKSTDGSQSVSCLFRYTDGASSKVAENAEDLIAYSCADNWAYYSKTDKVRHGIFDFIEDDCLELDKELVSNVNEFNITEDVLLAMRRNQLRKNMSKASIEKEYISIGYYSNGNVTELESKCTEICAVDLNGRFISLSKKTNNNGYNQNKSGLTNGQQAAIMLESTQITDSLIKFSSIPSSIVSSNSFYSYIQTLYSTTVFKSHSNIITADRKVTVETDTFSDNTVAFSNDYTSFYYVATSTKTDDTVYDAPATLEIPVNPNARDAEKTETEKTDSDDTSTVNTGDLMCVKLVGDASVQPIAVDVEKFELLNDGSVIYITSDSTVYIGSVALATRAKSFIVNQSRTAAAILGDSGETGSRLIVYKEGATKPIADNVSNVVFNDDFAISFIKDYDKLKARGDLYVCRNFGTPSRIDSGVSTLVAYPY